MKYLIVKIFDPDCDICAETDTFDTVVAKEMGIPLKKVCLADILRRDTSLFMLLYEELRVNHAEDGEVSLPIYLLQDTQTDQFFASLGEFSTAEEFQQQLKKLLLPK